MTIYADVINPHTYKLAEYRNIILYSYYNPYLLRIILFQDPGRRNYNPMEFSGILTLIIEESFYPQIFSIFIPEITRKFTGSEYEYPFPFSIT